MPSVAYIWSPELQRAADELPANVGRSSLVHGLVRALGLLENTPEANGANAADHIDGTSNTGGANGADTVGGKDEPGRAGPKSGARENEGLNGESNGGSGNGLTLIDANPTSQAGPTAGMEGSVNGNGRSGEWGGDASRVGGGNGGTDGEQGRDTSPTTADAAISANGDNEEGDDGGDDGEEDEDDDDPEPQEEPIRGIRVVPPDLAFATRTELRRYHEQRYLDYVLQAYAESSPSSSSSSSEDEDDWDDAPRKRRREAMGLEDDCPRFPALRAYVPLVGAATLTACRLLVSGTARTAIVWDGGRHHALRGRASGFCYVADAVLGIMLLAREGVVRVPRASASVPASVLGAPILGPSVPAPFDPALAPVPTPAPPPRPRRPRILYLDLDLHYGDGVATAFASPTHFPYPLAGRPRPPQVLTLSIHHASRVFFPPGAPSLTPKDTPHPFSLSLPLAAFAHPASYARAWACVEMIRAAWSPDYVVLQLGVDGFPGDRIGQWGAWSPHGEGGSSWVVEKVLAWGVPLVLLGGGGYEHADAARAWALATGVVVGREMGRETDVPDHEGIEAFAPGFTLEVAESNVPDENTEEGLREAEETYAVLARRIAEIVAL